MKSSKNIIYFVKQCYKFVFFLFLLHIICFILSLNKIYNNSCDASGNTTNESYTDSKKWLSQIYNDHRVTFYCEAIYDSHGKVFLPSGFNTSKYKKRVYKIEWEHVVPAENFGMTFSEWRIGHNLCTYKGKKFKGRKCAEKVNREYRFMQADMYNLYPAIGSVNALRRNYNFQLLPDTPSSFGNCPMKISNNRVEPPPQARGAIARTYLYMQANYPRYRMNQKQEQLMKSWSTQYKVDEWECLRAKRIEYIQGNSNEFVKSECIKYNIW